MDAIVEELSDLRLDATRSRGLRNLARKARSVRELAAATPLRALVDVVLDPSARLVRSILFDKTAGANWSLRWHQDVTVAVERRIETPGYGAWSVKEGVHSVQPPAAVLQRMVTVRVHLDDCGVDNGALRVIPKSHRHGRLEPGERRRLIDAGPEVLCIADAGGALVMRPLLLHASSTADSPSHRRIVHLDFASGKLDGGLEWSREA